MKKLFCILTCVCVLMALCVMTASAETTIPETKITVGSKTAYVDGEAVTLDIAPVLTDGEVLVSVYYTSQFVGATPSWDNTTKTASFKTENTTIELTIDSTTAKVNGESVAVPVAPFYSSSRAVVPVRFVAENLGSTVLWDADTQTMIINPTIQSMFNELGIEIPWDGEVDYTSSITRKQFAVLLAQIVTAKTGLDTWNKDKTSTIFTDVTEYGTAIDYLKTNGILSGRNSTTFGPDDTVLYQDSIVIAVRILGYQSSDMTYPDGFVAAAQKLGIIDSTDALDQPISVDSTLQLMWNVLNTEIAVTDPTTNNIIYPGETGENGYLPIRTTLLEKFNETTQPDYDIDGDGVVSVKDVITSLDALLNNKVLDGADMNGDGKLTLIDILLVLKSITA